MKKPLRYKELALFHAQRPARERFGPNSENPYIVFYIEGSDTSLSDWLTGLPCPVIGIGSGALENACDVVLPTEKTLALLAKNIKQTPIAAMVLVQHLRASEHLSPAEALTAESFAYAALQNGPEFKRWTEGYTGTSIQPSTAPDIQIDIKDSNLSLTLNRPDTRNAIGTQMRDALSEALDLALTDKQFTQINLTGRGATFSIGGAVEEFGKVSDPATAHWIRSLRLPAWRLARLQNKLAVHVNGAAIGAGLEMAAFGSHVKAAPKAWFQLPELKYGLIPGAGGTASIPRRVGRQKTAYMALSMKKIRAETALEWGLIDEIVE